ncbi:MAG: extracellular solute-binding protein [Alphaproteobacteria bacterium]|nr:extracellular solute-binding protein [Alphaproteobacteria bacterium]
MDRRTLVKCAIAGSALSALGAFGGRSARAQATTLRVMHYGGPYAAFDKVIGEPFAKTGVARVQYSADLTTTAYTKLEADPRNPPYDAFMSVRTLSVRYAGSGLLAPVDQSSVPNLAGLDKDSVVPGGMGAAMILEHLDLMYNKKAAKSPVTSWLDLWRPEFNGRIALAANNTVTPLYLIAMYARAVGSNERDPKAVEEAFAKYRELKPRVRAFTTDPVQVSTMIDRGEADIGPQYGIRISTLAAQNADVTRTIPKEGVIAVPLDLVLPKQTPNLAAAYKYMDFVLSPAIQGAIAETLTATPSNKTAPVSAEVKSKILTDYTKLVYLDEAYLGTVREDWLGRWQREIQR